MASYINENFNFNYPNMAPNSDSEEEEKNFVTCKKGIGDHKLRKVFDNFEEFKEALVHYVSRYCFFFPLYIPFSVVHL